MPTATDVNTDAVTLTVCRNKTTGHIGAEKTQCPSIVIVNVNGIQKTREYVDWWLTAKRVDRHAGLSPMAEKFSHRNQWGVKMSAVEMSSFVRRRWAVGAWRLITSQLTTLEFHSVQVEVQLQRMNGIQKTAMTRSAAARLTRNQRRSVRDRPRAATRRTLLKRRRLRFRFCRGRSSA